MKVDYRYVEIIWDDAFSQETWQEVEAIGSDKHIHECLTRGFLVKEDDSHYYVATTISGTQAACVMAVTKKMVKSMYDLKPRRQSGKASDKRKGEKRSQDKPIAASQPESSPPNARPADPD